MVEVAAPAVIVDIERHQDEMEGEADATNLNDGAAIDPKTLANRRKKEKKKTKKDAGVAQLSEVPLCTLPPTAYEDSEPLALVVGDQSPSRGGSSMTLSTTASPNLASVASSMEASPLFAPFPKKAGKERKECAAAKAARERLELQQRLEEERHAFEAAQRLAAEKEERRLREEQEAAEAERQRRRDAKHAKVERAKAEGTYLTKSQKLKAARAAQAREQLSPALKFKAAASPSASPAASPLDGLRTPACTVLAADALTLPPATGEGGGAEFAVMDKGVSRALVAGPKLAAEKTLAQRSDILQTVEGEGPQRYRSPVACVMGHVDTGKTKLLDCLRRSHVQEREAGGITQQIGATFFPRGALVEQTKAVDSELGIRVPGLLVIDTPGHESFNNLRARGSSLCDVAVIVVDIMHGLEPQTIESIEMLQELRCPFIVALNKIDVLYGWASKQGLASARAELEEQGEATLQHFQTRLAEVKLSLQEKGFNVGLWWDVDFDCSVPMVPTSARTGTGIPDLIHALLLLAQGPLAKQVGTSEELRCTVMEVRHVDGLGTTIDVLLVGGMLREGDQIVLAGLAGPIVTTIRVLLTPQPMKETRMKGEYVQHASIGGAMGVRISAPGLEKAVCGSEVLVARDDKSVEELKETVQSSFKSIFAGFEKEALGVYVKASTIGSLEALLAFLRSMEIPVSDMGIGEVHKKDVKQAAIMKERRHPEYALIMAFDVKVSPEAKKDAKHAGVQLLTADVIYHLFDQFKRHMEQTAKTPKTRVEAVFPALLDVYKPCALHGSDPSQVWCEVVGGQLRIGTPLVVLSRGNAEIGHVREMQKAHKPADIAYAGDRVCITLEQRNARSLELSLDGTDQLCSLISQRSCESLKEEFHRELRHADWALLERLKKNFKVE